jgi:hypothetical protein
MPFHTELYLHSVSSIAQTSTFAVSTWNLNYTQKQLSIRSEQRRVPSDLELPFMTLDWRFDCKRYLRTTTFQMAVVFSLEAYLTQTTRRFYGLLPSKVSQTI